MNNELNLENYDFVLPKELIAQEPTYHRPESRLMVYYKQKNKTEHLQFKDIVNLIDDSWCIVLNKTKVEPRKIYCKKTTGGEIVIIITHYEDNQIKCILSPSKKLKLGQEIVLPNNVIMKITKKDYDTEEIVLEGDIKKAKIEKLISENGFAPLPPYIKRDKFDSRNSEDLIRYQTVYADTGCSIAAPTAGLHFNEEILSKLVKKGIEIIYINLNIGIGTFKLLNVKKISEHKMLPEFGEIEDDVAERISELLKKEKKMLCVGTTTTRLIEYVFNKYGKIVPFKGLADIFIYPGYEFKIVSGLITNFHLPKSTNFVLLSAFIGIEKAKELYDIAIKKQYRFYSYGDVMMII